MGAEQHIVCHGCGAKLKIKTRSNRVLNCPRCDAVIYEPGKTHRDSAAKHDQEATKELLAVNAPTREENLDELVFEPTAFRTKKKKKKPAVTDAPVKPDDDEPVRKRNRLKPTTQGMISSTFAPAFWQSAMRYYLYMVAPLACIGALLGFLWGLVRSEAAAAFILNVVGMGCVTFTFYLVLYPVACYWRVLIGSVEGDTDIEEWPEEGAGSWAIDMLLVMYMALITLILAATVAKIQEVAVPNQMSSKEYWQFIGSEREVNKVEIGLKLLPGAEISKEVESSRPVFDPGPAWWTVLVAFCVLFPLITLSCLDPTTPILVPLSPRVLRSLVVNLLGWLIVWISTGALFGALSVGFILGANRIPFITGIVAAPIVAFAMLFYGRLLGRHLWVISKT